MGLIMLILAPAQVLDADSQIEAFTSNSDAASKVIEANTAGYG